MIAIWISFEKEFKQTHLQTPQPVDQNHTDRNKPQNHIQI